jgi:hypothetical protein
MPTRSILSAITILAAFTLIPGAADAQSLAKASSIRCVFPLMASSSLRDEPPKVEIKPPSPVLEMQFDQINADEGTAQWKSGYGVYDIVVRYAQPYLNFIQSFREGHIYLTTVLEQKNKNGKFKAMHSRHEFTLVSLPGFTSSPEQYYGECEVLK